MSGSPEHPFRKNDVLSPLGYQVEFCTREKYFGSGQAEICIASKGGVKYYASKISLPDCSDHHRRIQRIQDSNPRMAKIVLPVEDVILSEEARGQNLWGMETPPDPDTVEAQLLEFAEWTRTHDLVHGDLRPWNVFFDDIHGVQVIDWPILSAFVDDLQSHGGLPPRRLDLVTPVSTPTGSPGHYYAFHRDLVERGAFTEIDRMDALLIGKLLRGEIELREAWPGISLSRYPPWLKSTPRTG